ncbi:MAG: hypothetical protein ACYTFA_10415 [Planctomycetota bacterium]
MPYTGAEDAAGKMLVKSPTPVYVEGLRVRQLRTDGDLTDDRDAAKRTTRQSAGHTFLKMA